MRIWSASSLSFGVCVFGLVAVASAGDFWEPTTSEDTHLLYASLFLEYDAALAAETRDEAWATSMEKAMQDDIDSRLAAGTELLVAHCGATICRFALRFPDYQSREQFHRFPLESELYDGELAYWHREDGRTIELAIPKRDLALPSVGAPVERPDEKILDSFQR